MTVSHPRTREERLRAVSRSARSLWMTEPNVPAHLRHEVMVRLTALELHVEQLDLVSTSATSPSPIDIDLGLSECETELFDLASHWDIHLDMGEEVAA